MTNTIALGKGAEFDAIRAMVNRWGARAVGIGDDAALVPIPRGDTMVVSVDTAVEGRHFKPGWLTPREISYRAVTAALSDLAAMAARPAGVIVAITLPERWRASIDDLSDGIGDALDAASTVIRGGNLSDGDDLSITTTVLGSAFSPVSRAGAHVGDDVYLTGTLGAPRLAWRRLEAGESPGVYRERLARPVARIPEARWLADHGISAAIDVSDGLIADLGHLAAASGVGIDIDATHVPLFEGVSHDDALVSGEEYELIVTSPNELDVAEFKTRFAIPLTRIGAVVRSEQRSVSVRGAVVAGLHGYDHLSR